MHSWLVWNARIYQITRDVYLCFPIEAWNLNWLDSWCALPATVTAKGTWNKLLPAGYLTKLYPCDRPYIANAAKVACWATHKVLRNKDHCNVCCSSSSSNHQHCVHACRCICFCTHEPEYSFFIATCKHMQTYHGIHQRKEGAPLVKNASVFKVVVHVITPWNTGNNKQRAEAARSGGRTQKGVGRFAPFSRKCMPVRRPAAIDAGF